MAMNSSIYHPVPVMMQPQGWACWYTSLQMVVAYYRSCGIGYFLTDPSEDPEAQKIFDANQGIGSTSGYERERIARRLGFMVGYVSLTAEGMWNLLRKGPIIYAGQWPGQLSGHWVVIVGISATQISINDPGAGRRTWDYNFFTGRYLLQTHDRPLIYPY